MDTRKIPSWNMMELTIILPVKGKSIFILLKSTNSWLSDSYLNLYLEINEGVIELQIVKWTLWH